MSLAAHATSAISWCTDSGLFEGFSFTWAYGREHTCLKGLAGLPFLVVYVLTERRDSVKAGCRVQIPPELPRVIPAKFCRGSMAWGVARAPQCGAACVCMHRAMWVQVVDMHACWVGHSEGSNHQPCNFPITLRTWTLVAVS